MKYSQAMVDYTLLVDGIIKEQELIIGPLAWDEARKVHGVHVVDARQGTVEIHDGDDRLVIDNLVAQYERLFGKASREACREAVGSLIAELTPAQIPDSLKEQS